MRCPNGHEVRPGVKFCKTCGALVEPGADRSDESTPTPTPMPARDRGTSAPSPPETTDEDGPRPSPDDATAESSQGPPENGKAEKAGGVWGHRLRRVAVVALLSLSLIGLGVVLGWFALGQLWAPARDEPEVIEVPVAEFLSSEGDGQVVMPDVRGLTEEAARAVLADAGIPAEAVRVQEQPSAGTVGLIVAQEPAFGVEPVEAVLLALSVEAAVPDVAGQTSSEAQAALAALGTRVVVERRYVPGTDPGVAMGTQPEPGSALPESVTLVISEAPGSVYLDQLDTVADSRSCSSDEAVVDGQEYTNSLQCRAEAEPEEYVWLLGRKVETFESVIGVPDDGDQSARVDVTVLADGAPIAQGTAAYGQPLKVNASVSGAIQLQIRVRATSVDPDSYDDVFLVLADARLIGSTTGIGELAGWSE